MSALAVAVVAGAPPLIALVLRWLGPFLAREPARSSTSMVARIREALSVSLDSLERVLADSKTTLAAALCNVAIFSIAAAQFWLVGYSLGFTLNAAEAWALLGTALLAGIVTLLPLGIGTFDVVLASLLGATDQSLNSGAAAVLLVRATMTLPLGLAAIASYLYLMSSSAGGHGEASDDALR